MYATGKGLKGITAIFDAEDRPAWLKSVALRFAVVASRSFDDSSPSKGDHTMPENSVKADDKPSLPVHKSPAAEQVCTAYLLSGLIPSNLLTACFRQI